MRMADQDGALGDTWKHNVFCGYARYGHIQYSTVINLPRGVKIIDGQDSARRSFRKDI